MKKARWRILGALLLVLLIAAVAVAPWAFRTYVEGAPDPALTLPTDTRPATTDMNGSWTVTGESQAGYRAEQQLLWLPVYVNGRTSGVTGSAQVDMDRLVSADFTVDITSIRSAHPGRDERFRSTDVMNADKYPTAELRVTAPADLTSVPDTGKPVDLDILTHLKLKGVAKPVTAHVRIQRNGDQIDIAGAIPIRFYDFNVDPPKPFASLLEVQPVATIEFLVHLART